MAHMQHLIEYIEKLPKEERKANAERCLLNYDHFGDIAPGYLLPNYGNWPNKEKAERILSVYEEDYYLKLKALLDNEVPEIFNVLYERFKDERTKMLEVLKLSSEERSKLPMFKLPPFFTEFSRNLRRCAPKNGYMFETNLDKLNITTELLGKGGFAEVYKAFDKEGKAYAIKYFYPHFLLSRVRQIDEDPYVENKIMKNISNMKDMLKNKPFIAPRAIYEKCCYIMDFFDGKNVESIIEENKNFKENKEAVGEILFTYASMLKNLHSKELLFVDNSPNNILFGKDGIGICDYDFISLENEVNQKGHFARVHKRIYSGREQILEGTTFATKSTELESLALIVDFIYTGTHFLSWNYQEHREKDVKAAKENKRIYPKKRYEKIPKKLRDIITLLLTYPRDDSINSSDFVSSIKTQYNR